MFSERLKALRMERHLTQETLASIIGVERSSIGKYEGKSKVLPSEQIRQSIAEFFDVSMDYLMGKSDVRKEVASDALQGDELELISIFRRLNTAGKESLMTYARERLELPSMTDREQMLA